MDKGSVIAMGAFVKPATRIVMLVMLVASCSKEDKKSAAGASGGADQRSRPAPFSIAIHKLETKATVAPNKTYEEQGLSKKPAAGNVFACVQYTLTNTSSEEEIVKPPKLVDAQGGSYELSTAAAGSYMPEDWPADRTSGRLKPATSAKQNTCFEVPSKIGTGLKLTLVDTGWGKQLPWSLEVELPAPGVR